MSDEIKGIMDEQVGGHEAAIIARAERKCAGMAGYGLSEDWEIIKSYIAALQATRERSAALAQEREELECALKQDEAALREAREDAQQLRTTLRTDVAPILQEILASPLTDTAYATYVNGAVARAVTKLEGALR